MAEPIEGFISASPDGRWVAVRTPASVGISGDGVIASTSGDAGTSICRGCEIDWLAGGQRLVVRSRNRTLVFSFDDQTLAKWPSGGIRPEDDLNGLPLISSENGSLYPGPTPDQYAFVRGASQRNIYRVPVPRQ
jgi:hypothetical protein